VFISETQIIAAGHDCSPYLFELTAQGWQLVKKLDASTKRESFSSTNTAMNMFKQMATKGQATTEDTELQTVHQNTITYALFTLNSLCDISSCINVYAKAGNNVTKISTSGGDGKLVIWDLLPLGIKAMKI
jgi:actin related protein 2/3 complex subunit 1A/1B